MSGGEHHKHHKHHEHKEDDSSSSCSSSEEFNMYKMIRKYRQQTNMPFYWWWYSPIPYQFDTFFVPTFTAPLSPYFEVVTTNWYLA